MLLPGTQMHIITFIFVSLELVIFFILVIYKFARPDDKTAFLNIVLITLLITYNVTGGLLPDPNLPGSIFIQEAIAYGTGFITPCYFPYYVYKAFGLEKMEFHANKGVFLCLILPYFLFVIVYASTHNLGIAKNLLVLPVLYALWIFYSLLKALQYKYGNNFRSKESKEEVAILFLSITPWIGLPIVSYFNLSQAIEASITNPGFLLLLALQVNRHIKQLRTEHQKLLESEFRLLSWNTKLQEEVYKRTRVLEKINEQRTYSFVNLAHETKTPLTLINNYLEEYINKNGSSEELTVVQRSIAKLSNDIINLFDLERFNKGISVYNHSRISNFSEIIKDELVMFKQYACKRNIEISVTIVPGIFIKADPVAINRIVNNLVENAIKFSGNGGIIEISLQKDGNRIHFAVKDCGTGIPPAMHKKIFQPYYQIANHKGSNQGMGLGLPIVNKVVEGLNGTIKIVSNPQKIKGTKIIVELYEHNLSDNERVSQPDKVNSILSHPESVKLRESIYDENKPTILVVEDNISMINYLIKKLGENYNVYASFNGTEALDKIKKLPVLPDLIISDIMMDKVDGFTLAKIISKDPTCNHIPFIFLSAKSTKQDKLLGLKLGAIDFIQKPFSIQELIQKTESILKNVQRQKKALLRIAFKASGIRDLRQNFTDTFEHNCKAYNLTSREKDIAKLIDQGYKYKEIGEALFIAERTVTKHVQNIFEKTDVKNKIEMINKLEASEITTKQLNY